MLNKVHKFEIWFKYKFGICSILTIGLQSEVLLSHNQRLHWMQLSPVMFDMYFNVPVYM